MHSTKQSMVSAQPASKRQYCHTPTQGLISRKAWQQENSTERRKLCIECKICQSVHPHLTTELNYLCYLLVTNYRPKPTKSVLLRALSLPSLLTKQVSSHPSSNFGSLLISFCFKMLQNIFRKDFMSNISRLYTLFLCFLYSHDHRHLVYEHA